MAQDYKTTHTVNGKEVKDALKKPEKPRNAKDDPSFYDAGEMEQLKEQQRQQKMAHEVKMLQNLLDANARMIKVDQEREKLKEQKQKNEAMQAEREQLLAYQPTSSMGIEEIMFQPENEPQPVSPDELFRVLGENRARARDASLVTQNPELVGQINDMEATIIPQLESMGFTRAEINASASTYQVNEAIAISGKQPNLLQKIFGITPDQLDPAELRTQLEGLGVDQNATQLLQQAFELRAQQNAEARAGMTAAQQQIQNDKLAGKMEMSRAMGLKISGQALSLWDGVYNGVQLGGGFQAIASMMEGMQAYMVDGSPQALAKLKDLEGSLKANLDDFVMKLSTARGELLDDSDIDLLSQQLEASTDAIAAFNIDAEGKQRESRLIGNLNSTEVNMMVGRKEAHELARAYVNQLRAALARTRNRWELRQKQQRMDRKQSQPDIRTLNQQPIKFKGVLRGL